MPGSPLWWAGFDARSRRSGWQFLWIGARFSRSDRCREGARQASIRLVQEFARQPAARRTVHREPAELIAYPNGVSVEKAGEKKRSPRMPAACPFSGRAIEERDVEPITPPLLHPSHAPDVELRTVGGKT